MKPETFEIEVGPWQKMKIKGYQAKGHLYVCRHPFSEKHWIIVHRPSGMSLKTRPMKTRRRALATARTFAENIPEFATQSNILDWAQDNRKLVEECLNHAVLLHVFEDVS